MKKVSITDGPIENAERCVCCGNVIPEGTQYCIMCGLKVNHAEPNKDFCGTMCKFTEDIINRRKAESKRLKKRNRILKLIAFIMAIIIAVLVYVLTGRTPTEAVASEPSAHLPSIEIEEVEPEYTLYDVPLDESIQRAALDICTEYGLSYEFILGVISVECASFEPDTIGDGGASFGLMQIQPKWWSKTMEENGVINLLDPLDNIRCGCAILRELKDKYGTYYRALQVYNTGRPDTNNGYADRVYKAVGELKLSVG